jgi:[ribosomal protein S18]-alanine N-acetyltransferase
MQMIRIYTAKDREAILEILRLNTPQFFGKDEETDIIHYLENEIEDYYVVEEIGKIIGSGGINYFIADGLARISWDLIHPNHKGKGLGKQLVDHRINKIKKNPAVQTIVVRTSQFAHKFYKKMGLTLERIDKDFWAVGLDLYQMKMHVDRTPSKMKQW